jgi:hypothetical protein
LANHLHIEGLPSAVEIGETRLVLILIAVGVLAFRFVRVLAHGAYSEKVNQ